MFQLFVYYTDDNDLDDYAIGSFEYTIKLLETFNDIDFDNDCHNATNFLVEIDE